LLNLAKRVVSDGEGSSKFVTVNVKKCKSEIEAKQIALSIANSPLVKTAIAGEDPNWGRIIMAIGKAGPKINLKKLLIKFGNIKIVQDGKLYQGYDESRTSEYLRKEIEEDELVMKKKFTEGVDYINRWWKKKAIKRYTKLHSEGRLKPEHLFYIDAIGMSWEQMKDNYLKEVGR